MLIVAPLITTLLAALLRNFLAALDIARITPKRFLLQTGAKNYGVHIGPARTPMVESDPRVTLEPNFYYPVSPRVSNSMTSIDFCTARRPSL